MRTATTMLLGALAAGCADTGTAPASPRADAAAGPVAAAVSTAGTQGAPVAAQAADTARPGAYPTAVRVTGRVLATVWAPGRTVADTLGGFEPVLGARVTLYRNVLVDGRGVSQRIGERETGADGAFAFEGVPGGPYVLALNVGPGRPYGEAVWYLMGDAAEVSATLRVWTRPVSADSTRGP